MHRPMRLPFTLSILAVLAAIPGPLHAADWPTRPVTVIVPFGAGGNTDMMARLGAQHLTAKFGQTFVVENRPSAGGALGTGQVATAAPDGYTLLFSASANINLTPQLQKLAFDPVKQLVPITNVGTGTQIMAIKRSLPVTTLPEFIAYAKANPGKLNLSGGGHAEHQPPRACAAVRAGRARPCHSRQGRPPGGLRPHGRPGRCLFRQRLRTAAAHQQRQDQAAGRRHGAADRRRARHSDRRRNAAGFRILVLERLLPRQARSEPIMARDQGQKSRRLPNRPRCPNV